MTRTNDFWIHEPYDLIELNWLYLTYLTFMTFNIYYSPFTNMTHEQLLAFLPFILLAAASIVVIPAYRFSIKSYSDPGHCFWWCVAGDTCHVVCKRYFAGSDNAIVCGGWLRRSFTGLIIFSIMVVGLFSFIYFEEKKKTPRSIIFFLFLGNPGVGAANHQHTYLISFSLAWIIKHQFASLISYLRNRNNAVEAGMKYLVLAAMISAFLLFGMALDLYG